MSADGPNTRYLRVDLGSIFTAAALARSWREGRVDPDEILEFDGKRLTFRQACSEDEFLRNEIGVLPAFGNPKKRSRREERLFRREAWHRVVKNGELGGVLLAERIDRLTAEIDNLRTRCTESDNRLAAAARREKDLVAVLRAGAEDAGELEAICKVCEDTRTDGLGTDALGKSQARVLERLATRLRSSFLALADDASRNLRVPDQMRIEQIVLFHKQSHEETGAARRQLLNEINAWTRESERRKVAIGIEIRKAKDSIEKERKDSENQLLEKIRSYWKEAALHGKWRKEVSCAFQGKHSSGRRLQVGNVMASRPDWLVQSILSYAPMVSPDSVLAIFKSGGPFSGARCGFLVAWDGLHWSTPTGVPGFLPWGWHGSCKVVRGLFGLGADVEVDGRTISVWRAGSDNELESFFERVDEANRALPEPTFLNGGAASFRRVSSEAIRSIQRLFNETKSGSTSNPGASTPSS